jgi:hypothetical protein
MSGHSCSAGYGCTCDAVDAYFEELNENVGIMNALRRQRDASEKKLTAIKVLADLWAVDDDTYLHMESCQDLGYADAAVQLLTILAGVEGNQP